jgi:hypothetical protein
MMVLRLFLHLPIKTTEVSQRQNVENSNKLDHFAIPIKTKRPSTLLDQEKHNNCLLTTFTTVPLESFQGGAEERRSSMNIH